MILNRNHEKQRLLDAFENSLLGIGYSGHHIQKQYGYSNFLSSSDGERLIVDIAAFAGGVASLRTCNIGVVLTNATPEEMVKFRALGAPLLFTYDLDTSSLSRWGMPKSGLPKELDSKIFVGPDELSAYFTAHRTKWEPEAFRQARTAIFRKDVAQLDFFDIGLLPALEGELQRKLSNHIQNIAARSREIINERNGDGAFEKRFAGYARLLFRLIAGRLLMDRGDLPNLSGSSNVTSILSAVEAKYADNDNVESALNDVIVQNEIWSALQRGLDLRNLSPETLAFVYENTLVDANLRRSNGIHSTPPHVADYILRQLPIERLPESGRTVFEPFCGNAPFLLAAMRRLHELLPSDRTPTQVHEYLVERLLGIEILPIAREIALYSLILGDYPNDNSWQIIRSNAFTDLRFDEFLQRADIVLSNPPHEDFHPGTRPNGAHLNQSAEGLSRILENPPKLLGFVMPFSFVDANKFKALRRKLVDTYPDIMVTALPDSVFGNASQETALIAAHRLDAEKRYIWAGLTNNRETNITLPGSTWTKEQSMLPMQGNAPILWQRLHDMPFELWQHLSNNDTLETVATIHRGLEWKKVDGQKYSTANVVSLEETLGFKLGLPKVNKSVEEYVAVEVPFIETRPERVRGNALRWGWESPKAIVNAAPTSRGLWRLVCVADTEGIFASQRFIGIWPRQQTEYVMPVSVLAAILNGAIANAFMQHRCGKRDNDVRVLKLVPIPPLTPTQVEEVNELVNSYVDLRWEGLESSLPWDSIQAQAGRRALLKIDAAILEAYALPSELEATLLRQFNSVDRGHLPFSFSGFDAEEWADVKAELAADREARRLANELATLIKKYNANGLNLTELNRYKFLQTQRELRRIQHRDLIASAR